MKTLWAVVLIWTGSLNLAIAAPPPVPKRVFSQLPAEDQALYIDMLRECLPQYHDLQMKYLRGVMAIVPDSVPADTYFFQALTREQLDAVMEVAEQVKATRGSCFTGLPRHYSDDFFVRGRSLQTLNELFEELAETGGLMRAVRASPHYRATNVDKYTWVGDYDLPEERQLWISPIHRGGECAMLINFDTGRPLLAESCD